jgi:hypothetical protein
VHHRLSSPSGQGRQRDSGRLGGVHQERHSSSLEEGNPAHANPVSQGKHGLTLPSVPCGNLAGPQFVPLPHADCLVLRAGGIRMAPSSVSFEECVPPLGVLSPLLAGSPDLHASVLKAMTQVVHFRTATCVGGDGRPPSCVLRSGCDDSGRLLPHVWLRPRSGGFVP